MIFTVLKAFPIPFKNYSIEKLVNEWHRNGLQNGTILLCDKLFSLVPKILPSNALEK